MKIEIRILRPDDDRSDFHSGEGEIDWFFHSFAGQNQFRHYIGTSYVAVDAEGRILGYVTVSAGSMESSELSDTLAKKLPRYPLPIFRINRLGVDRRWKGRGIGRALISAMFRLAVEQKEKLGCVGIVVDAKREAISFYEGLGFVSLDVVKGEGRHYPRQTTMFLAIGTVEKALKTP